MFRVTEDIKVLRTDPPDGRSNVPLNAEIKIYFSQAVEPATLNTGTIIVARNSSTPIAGSVRYESNERGEFIGVFRPSVILHAETTYQVAVIGLANPFTGNTNTVIKNVVGNSMGRNYILNFSTGMVDVQPPVPELPVESSAVADDKPLFQWTPVSGAVSYELEIGTSELMDPLYLPEGSQLAYPLIVPGTENQFVPDASFVKGAQYYWRIRAYKGGVWSAWSILRSFYVLQIGEDNPYAPRDDQFIPTGDSYLMLNTTEPFTIIAIDPLDGAVDQLPDTIRVTFNKAIDPDSIDPDLISFIGRKVVQSDPNIHEPGAVDFNAYVDDEETNVLIIDLTGSSGGGGVAGGTRVNAQMFENMFADILYASGLHYGFGKHFMDLTERVVGSDELYTDVRNSQLRLNRNMPFTTGLWKHTTFERAAVLPFNVQDITVRAKFTIEDHTELEILVSMDGGVNFSVVNFVYDPVDNIQKADVSVTAGNALQFDIRMKTGNSSNTPRVEWIMLLFNEAV